MDDDDDDDWTVHRERNLSELRKTISLSGKAREVENGKKKKKKKKKKKENFAVF